MDTESAGKRERLRAEFDAAWHEFHAMAVSIPEERWTMLSNNPGWTNGQILFHVLLGFILVLPLANLLVFFGHLPRALSKAFAAGLNPIANRPVAWNWGSRRGRALWSVPLPYACSATNPPLVALSAWGWASLRSGASGVQAWTGC
jgi:hypothetical protein